jgi:hypothetical protein
MSAREIQRAIHEVANETRKLCEAVSKLEDALKEEPPKRRRRTERPMSDVKRLMTSLMIT